MASSPSFPDSKRPMDDPMEPLFSHFDARARNFPAQGPGFSAVVLRQDSVVYELHRGVSSVELQVPLNGDTAYYLASESKQFTAACVWTLIRDGMLSLHDDVSKHLPELAAFEQPFTVANLLNHSSGIPDYFKYLHAQLGRHEGDYFSNQHLLRMISCFDELEFVTGTQHRYSNSNYILLATLVERLSGRSMQEFATERLFAPRGIKHIQFDADRFSIIPHRAFSYESDGTRPLGLKQLLGNANTVGDGGAYASTNELIRWERHWHAEWKAPGSLLRDMLQPLPLSDGSIPAYRSGLEIGQHAGHEYVFHGGGLWGFRTLILRIPALELSVIHLANHDKAGEDEGILLKLLCAE
ncbi:serine hydrolase domain-containing protein [Stenotrophomonas sp. PS02289]|uniref:serine hydrolase domain-containing protein n=1 Tax=Stenotrophomonas sp. PS02289 TaxID=2991422 RepID=UPI00249AFB8D|nr:serine hydrolase domain-containing protein [Stenotrophomonas sp. PS02289]